MMITKQVNEICKKMNSCGQSSTPFFFALNFDITEGIFIENPLKQDEVLFDIRGKGNKNINAQGNKKYSLTSNPISFESYHEMYSEVQKAIEQGTISVVNLTVKTPLEIDASLLDIFYTSNSLYQVYIPNRFVCFSPEQFIRIKEGKIYTNPMKGTIDASIPDAEQIVLKSEKEIKEHSLVVGMVLEELRNVAQEIEIERFRYVDRIQTQDKEILQISSELSGVLPNDYLSHLGDIIFRMLPASSILGVPKIESQQLINKVERESRGFYTGICGYFDGEELNSGVLIRFIEQDGDKLYFRSGGGITINSNAKGEYQEVLNKIYLPK